MKKNGITIDAITPQNEPLHPGNNPSMYMTRTTKRFHKNNLGPAFRAANITTKIVLAMTIIAINQKYPITILPRPEAAQYVDGSAFHLYAEMFQLLVL